jgi:Ca-activated chloride channel family protein
VNIDRFNDPVWFLALLCLVPIVVRMFRHRRQVSVVFSSLSILDGIGGSWRSRVRPWLMWLRVLGLVCVVVALARPQQGISGFRERREGVAIQICLDRSTSMSAQDFELQGDLASRLKAVKEVIRQFVMGNEQTTLAGRPDDQIGLVAFGGFAEVRCPETLDHTVFLDILKSVQLPEPVRNPDGSVLGAGYNLYQEEGATAIGDALALSADQLRTSDAKSKVIILLSDGEHNAGVLSPDQAIAIAKQFDIRVYSIGVGSTGRRFIRVIDAFGNVQYRPKDLRLDQETLTKIAEETGGRYFHADNTASLVDVYKEIDALEKTSTEGTVYRDYRELCFPWLLAGLLLIATEIVLGTTMFRGIP